jgi:hypothetical protein
MAPASADVPEARQARTAPRRARPAVRSAPSHESTAVAAAEPRIGFIATKAISARLLVGRRAARNASGTRSVSRPIQKGQYARTTMSPSALVAAATRPRRAGNGPGLPAR